MPDSDSETHWSERRKCNPGNHAPSLAGLRTLQTSYYPAHQQLFVSSFCATCPVKPQCRASARAKGPAALRGAAGGLTLWKLRELLRTGSVPPAPMPDGSFDILDLMQPA
jgi:hypothetical protein